MKRGRASSERLSSRSSTDLALVVGNLGVGGDVRGIDDGGVESSLHRVVEEDAVEDGARVLGDAEGDVADAEDGQHAGQLGLDAADALQRLQRAVA